MPRAEDKWRAEWRGDESPETAEMDLVANLALRAAALVRRALTAMMVENTRGLGPVLRENCELFPRDRCVKLCSCGSALHCRWLKNQEPVTGWKMCGGEVSGGRTGQR